MIPWGFGILTSWVGSQVAYRDSAGSMPIKGTLRNSEEGQGHFLINTEVGVTFSFFWTDVEMEESSRTIQNFNSS